MEKRSTLFLSLFCCITVCSARCADSISVLITQPEVYIVKNEWTQQINFNPNIANRSSEAVTLERIELCAYDASSRPICQKVLRDGPLMPSIGTVPNRNIPAGGRLTVFNPFTVFPISNFCTCVTYWRSAVNRSGALRPKSNSRPGFTNHRRFAPYDPLAVELLGGIGRNPGQFALDFSGPDPSGCMYDPGKEGYEAYYIFGQTVYAPGPGRIVRAYDDYEDNLPGRLSFTLEERRSDKRLFAGNCVVIDHLNGEYSFLVHLQRGSVTIREGEFVKRGEPIGRVGNSGSSTHPHLHYQLGDSPEYTDCNGLPLYFHRFRLVTGAERRTKVARSFLSAGDIVENK